MMFLRVNLVVRVVALLVLVVVACGLGVAVWRSVAAAVWSSKIEPYAGFDWHEQVTVYVIADGVDDRGWVNFTYENVRFVLMDGFGDQGANLRTHQQATHGEKQ